MLVLDLRPSQVFAGCQPRLRGSINVNIPSLLVKRFRQGNFTSFALKSFLPDEESQHRFEQSCPDGNWHKHRIFIVDEKIDEAELLCASNTSNAAVLAMALAQKQTEQGTFDNPVTVLRGTLQETVEQSALLSSDLVEHHIRQVTKSDVDTSAIQKKSTPAEVGITSGRLFSTPTLIPGISPPGSSELGASTPKAFLPMGSLESVPFEPLPAVSQAKQGPRKLRPLNLKHLNTSSSEQGLDSKLAVPPTPSVSSSPANNVTLQGTCPTPALPPPTIAHVGSSAPSRLPAIIMPDEAHATPKGPASFQVSVIIPGFLYLGPEPLQEEDAEELESIGIKRILNVATECNTQERWHGRFEKIASIPMRDSLAEINVQERFEEACMLLDDADLHAKPTYVHCKAGKSRSVTITLAYLIHR